MITETGKNSSDEESFRHIPRLPSMTKLSERLIVDSIKPFLHQKYMTLSHQFRFRKDHSIIDEVYRITDVIENIIANKGVCTAVFLDVAHAFDRVWYYIS